MTRIYLFMPAVFLMTVLSQPAMAFSKATDYLMKEHIKAACQGGGSFASAGLIERDITGDGKPDLILDHGGITCNDGNRSGQCGIRTCSVYFYVREGNLLKEKLEILSIGVTVAGGNPPRIKLVGHDFEESSVVWQNGQFQ